MTAPQQRTPGCPPPDVRRARPAVPPAGRAHTKRIAAAVAGIVAVLSVAGCDVDSGLVVSKTYHGEYVYTQFVPIGDGKTVTIVPEIIDVPECWGLYLRQGVPGQDGFREGEKCVDPGVFAGLRPGDMYERNGS